MSGLDERLAEELFRRVRRESPPDAVRRRVLAAVLAEPAPPSSLYVRARDALLPFARQPASIKLIAAVSLAGVAAAVFWIIRPEPEAGLSVRAEPLRAPSALAARNSAEAIQAPRMAPPPEPNAPLASARRPETRLVPQAPSRQSPPDLGDEITALDAVRKTLAGGDANGALTLLDAYAASGAKRMNAEATLLRIQALVQAGRRAEARALAERFVAANPTSALAERARSLAGLAAEAGAGGEE